jgi:hypothetical protein
MWVPQAGSGFGYSKLKLTSDIIICQIIGRVNLTFKFHLQNINIYSSNLKILGLKFATYIQAVNFNDTFYWINQPKKDMWD